MCHLDGEREKEDLFIMRHTGNYKTFHFWNHLRVSFSLMRSFFHRANFCCHKALVDIMCGNCFRIDNVLLQL